MAFFVLVGLVAVLIVYISLVKKKKRAVLISVVILGVFYFYVSRTCGPNSADVKVMKPMAEKISAYIVKHGIPESLKDIPDLPYKLYQKVDEDKDFYYFNIDNSEYSILLKSEDMLEFTSYNQGDNGLTRMWMIFQRDKEGNYKLKKPIQSFLVFGRGICSTMKQ